MIDVRGPRQRENANFALDNNYPNSSTTEQTRESGTYWTEADYCNIGIDLQIDVSHNLSLFVDGRTALGGEGP
jgi:hypothetical protein